VLECVPNVAEGRDPQRLRHLADACGPSLLDVHVDPDHDRAVLTLAGPGTSDALDAAQRLAGAVADVLDVRRNAGVHPLLGALDVVPFVALGPGTALADARAAADEFARWWALELRVPVFLFDAADAKGRSLPETRRAAFGSRQPDLGPSTAHPTLGATCVGARHPLVACNCMLRTDDVHLARRVARAVRERDGGLPGVRALGFPLPSRGRAQVSMNLVDLAATGVEAACGAVRDLARAQGDDVEAVELVGLLPRAELERCSAAFRAWARLDDDSTIEARLAAAPG
jgi:glutamate formiminotransferase